MAFVGLDWAGSGAAVFDRLGEGGDEILHQFRALGLQVVLLGGIGVQVVQLQRWQGFVFLCGGRLGGAPAAGAGAEGEFPFAAADGERAVDRVVNGERPPLGLRLAKQGREEGKRILVNGGGVAIATIN